MNYYKAYYCSECDRPGMKKLSKEDVRIVNALSNINLTKESDKLTKYLVDKCKEVREAAQIRYEELSDRVSSDSGKYENE